MSLSAYNPDFVRHVQARHGPPPRIDTGSLRIEGVPRWVSDLVNRVAARRRVAVRDVLSRNRNRQVAAARDEIFYLIRQRNPNLSFPRIGQWFDRHHTAVMFSVAKHAERTGLPKLTGYELDAHRKARRRFIEKRRVGR